MEHVEGVSKRRRPAQFIRALLVVGLAGVACVPEVPGPAPVPAPSPAGPHYMTDRVDLADITTANVDEVAATVTVTTWGCSDSDTCPAGSRLPGGGYVWFAAIQLDIGATPNGPVTYGMHGGLAIGGSGAQPRLYADWSGYCPDAFGGRALRSGGTACSSPSSNPTHKPHTVVDLIEGRPYRLNFRRTACNVSEVSDISGPLSGWQMTVTDTVTSAVMNAGSWCLPNASTIAHASVFSELYEPVACTTDLRSVTFANLTYRSPTGTQPFASARGHYNGNETTADANCSNVNLRSPTVGTIVDERMATKGSGGGLLADGPLW